MRKFLRTSSYVELPTASTGGDHSLNGIQTYQQIRAAKMTRASKNFRLVFYLLPSVNDWRAFGRFGLPNRVQSNLKRASLNGSLHD